MNTNEITEFSSLSAARPGSPPRVAVILAGGDGTRLRPLTRAIAGDERPKQFCPILDGETLLDRTRRRVAYSVRPEHTYFSLTAKHERYFGRPLWSVPARQKIVQPENKGTAPAILSGLLRVAAKHPDATVAFFPSDHFFTDDEAFMRSVDAAFETVRVNERSVLLLGIEPDAAETSYGWIEPADSIFGGLPGGIAAVKRFWEKPNACVARRLMLGGGLWNSFVMVGKVESFLGTFREHLPKMYRMFTTGSSGGRGEAEGYRSLYDRIDETNFSAEVLEQATDRLLVMRVAGVGWSDWGEPQRVLNSLEGLGVRPAWAASVAA
jgi:mannose-1-phosphate guanylyltransferase